MVIDISALLAILFGEPEREAFAGAIAADSKRLISAVSARETAIVVEARKGSAGSRELDLLLHRARVSIVAFAEGQMEIARDAWRRFGKGNHPASLNFGDCFSYALSRSSGEPLLFKGEDFSKTDVSSVL
ncbi:MAG: type II toxin-antitoxin system VapC family toxin [Candidatus Binataceae bacterium]